MDLSAEALIFDKFTKSQHKSIWYAIDHVKSRLKGCKVVWTIHEGKAQYVFSRDDEILALAYCK